MSSRTAAPPAPIEVAKAPWLTHFGFTRTPVVRHRF